MDQTYEVYFGGDLFDHKDLMGNALLASYINKCSKGRFTCYLPQNMDQSSATALEIRNEDLKKIVECDLALFNFDGAELDSGTVVEFIFAKLLDVPSVIMRSDFRSSGEKDVGGEDWNLMCSFYPRTETVQFSAIEYYQEAVKDSGSLNEAMDVLYERIANLLIERFDSVKDQPPIFVGDGRQLQELYEWAISFPGSGLDKLFPDTSSLEGIIKAKKEKGVI
jgi:hypothetical protein